MKPDLLIPFHQIFDKYQPKRICEIGTHSGKTANQFVRYICRTVPNLHYKGYDAFDTVAGNTEFAKKERNGKKHGVKAQAIKYLEHQKAQFPNFTYNLIEGFTQNTLQEEEFDFVYIDGGHSYETVKHDYNKVKGSTVIVFDDYNLPEVKIFLDELFEELGYPVVDWADALDCPKPCISFLPVIGKHIQPAIFNN